MLNIIGIRFFLLLFVLMLIAPVTLSANPALPTSEEAGLRVEPLGGGVFAVVGPTGGRTRDNLGMNATFGIIDTPEGAILIDSGASAAGA